MKKIALFLVSVLLFLGNVMGQGRFDWVRGYAPGEHVSIVGHAKIVDLNPFDDWGTAISIYNGSANCVYRCYIPQGAADMANWELKDLRYNPNTQKSYQLQEIIKICGE